MSERSEGVVIGGRQPLDSFAGVRHLNSVESKGWNIEVTLPIAGYEAGIFVLNEPSLPYPVDVHQVMVIEGLYSALPAYVQQGYSIAIEPFKCRRGTCTVVQDDFGTRICLVDPDSNYLRA
jgi:hypothetical protein